MSTISIGHIVNAILSSIFCDYLIYIYIFLFIYMNNNPEHFR